MPGTFERFFDRFGRSVEGYYGLTRLDPQYRVFYKDGDRLDIEPDLDQIRAVFESYEDGAADALDEAERTYEGRARVRDLIDPSILRAAPALTHLGSMQDYVTGYFDEPKLQQLLQYTLVFLGGSPHNTPSLYNLMTHVDFNLGVYYPKGGMYSLVEALVALGRELGVSYRTGTDVTALGPAGDGLCVTTTDASHVADSVVANANPAHVERDLLDADQHGREPGYWERWHGVSAPR